MQSFLQNLLEALLLSTSELVSVERIQGVLARYHHEQVSSEMPEDEGEDVAGESIPESVTAADVAAAADALCIAYSERGSPLRIVEGAQGFRFAVAPEYSDWVRLLREEARPVRLSGAALETLAIIAYRQPVTRAEMESIRGVSVDSALQKLLERELIYAVGRADLPGRPIQYGTSDGFLEFAGLKAIDELPASDVISKTLLDQWVHRPEEHRPPGNAELGLPGM